LQTSTSWNYAGKAIDANKVPYFVLPLPYSGGSTKFPGTKLGAVAAVIRGSSVIFAVFADNGKQLNIICSRPRR